MRGGILILGAVAGAFLTAPAQAGMADRLVMACEIALETHAGELELEFEASTRIDRDVHLSFSFEQAGKRYDAQARCSFRETVPLEALAPPSLEAFDVMGRSSPSMFLKSHHAIWEHFSPDSSTLPPAPAQAPEDIERPDTPDRPFRGKLIG